MNSYPDALIEELPRDEKVKKIEKIEGMGTKTAILFVDNIDKFKDFLKETNLEGKMKEVKEIEKKEYDTSHPLYGKNIVMTGFRNEKLSKALEGYGAKMSSSVNSKTFVLLVKDLDETTGKAEEAIKRNIEIMTPEMIIEKYNIVL
jgi:NAD-dependent DNA ligase